LHVQDQARALSRINEEISEEVRSRKFFNRASAVDFARNSISEYTDQKDQDFEIIEKDDPIVASHVVDSLICIAHEAKTQKAALVIPDYTSASPNSALIETALNFADFRGPVISVALQEQVAWDAETARQTYKVPGNPTDHKRGVLLDRATISVQVEGHAPSSVSVVAARLISAISRPDGGGEAAAHDAAGGPPNARATAVFAGGGQAVLAHVAEAVRVGAHVVILQGSGRLCDHLPRVWARRFSADFDAFEEGRRFCAACGFPDADGADDGRRLREVVVRGHVKVHALASGPHALRRVLRCAWRLDEALVQVPAAARRARIYMRACHDNVYPHDVVPCTNKYARM
jgi:hypothetical protein